MNRSGRRMVVPLAVLLASGGCQDAITWPEPEQASFAKGSPGPPSGGGGRPGEEAYGNNLSYPVVWAEGITKVLRGAPGVVNTAGAFVYWWGVDDDDASKTCAADPDNLTLCDDGVTGAANGVAPPNVPELRRAYVQKDPENDWQAETLIPASTVVVDSLDWGDNLESVPWYLNSRVRIETVQYDIVASAMTEYRMLHTFGLGTDEVWGLSVIPGAGTVETRSNLFPAVYSNCARLTIQRLLVDRLDPQVATLTWDATAGQWTGASVAPAIFNDAVYTAQDGPGYFNAEINVKGKVVYGYTWNVRTLNDGAGDYRITFSLDGVNCTRNTEFLAGVTGIMVPAEEEEVVAAAEPVGDGGITYLDTDNHLTYIDIRILPKKGTKGGGRPIR